MTLCAIALASSFIVLAYVLAPSATDAWDIQVLVRVRICGNAIVDADEACDDGVNNVVGVYASSTAGRHCEPGCESFGPYCGDGVLQVRYQEECDDNNNTSGDLCDASCKEEPPVIPRATGAPPRGSIPQQSAPPGTISSETQTMVILRGKAYPNTKVNILLDGQPFGVVNTDSNADFNFSATKVTPGIASFSFNAKDSTGVESITTTDVFEVVQAAVTTVTNIFLPPTISVYPTQVPHGGLIVLNGETVPNARVVTQIHSTSTNSLETDADNSGKWHLQYNVGNLADGEHTAKAKFTISDTIQSGFGKSVGFTVGTPAPTGSCGKPDMNGDGKVNLVDFSIFLLSWDTTESAADYNCDKRVNLADFSIMLFQWTG